MKQQRLLLDDDTAPWRLDDDTRRIGQRGVAEARAALAQARRHPAPADPTDDDEHSLAA
ncbi:MAG: hypothetical protein OES57_02810 [Acidimicrobiia bacterium]|nr:hypothetical protein [Acidimicrobiia bacterium]